MHSEGNVLFDCAAHQDPERQQLREIMENLKMKEEDNRSTGLPR